MNYRQVRFFTNFCGVCIHNVSIPVLGDFSYGELILQTKDGKDFGYAQIISEEAWSLISTICEQECGFNPKNINPELSIFQSVAVSCADELNAKQYSKEFPLCPNCGAKLSSYNDDLIDYDADIPVVTWTHFMGLTKDKQKNMVINLWDKEKNQQK